MTDTLPSYAPQILRRGSFAGVSPPAKLDAAFLRKLRRFDPELECHWHPKLEHWVLYRVKARGGVPADDILFKEFDVTGRGGQYRTPGPWLIDLLRGFDKTRCGSIHPGRANREYLKHLDRQHEREQAEKDKEEETISENFANDCAKYAMGRHSLHVNRT